MIGVFLRLWWWSFRGRIIRTARLARQPKYALGLIVGVMYFGWLVLRPAMQSRSDNFRGIEMAALDVIHLALALFAAFYVSLSWVFAPVRDGLKLRAAELTFLLGGPVPRVAVAAYAALKNVPSLLLAGTAIALFLTGGPPGERALHALFLSMMFLLWDVHGRARNQIRAWAATRPGPRAAVLLVRAGLGAYAAALVWQLVLRARDVYEVVRTTDEHRGSHTLARVQEALVSGPLPDLLAPFLWITGGRFTGDAGRAAAYWGLDLAVLAALVGATLLLPARFEIAAEGTKNEIRAVERRKRMSAARRAHRPFPLRPGVRPEVALLWKDVMVLSRRPLAHLAAAWFAVAVLAGAAVAWFDPPAGAVGGASLFLLGGCAWMAFFTGILWTNGFRRDLFHLESLRTWPVSGTRMALGQAAAPVLQATAVAVAAMTLVLAADAGLRTAAALGAGGAPGGIVPHNLAAALHGPDVLLLPLFLLGALVVLLAGSFTSASLECITTMWFPGWLLMTDRQKSDPAALGQRLLFSVGFFVVITVGALPGAAMVGLTLLAQNAVGIPVSVWELPLLGLLGAAPLLLEGALLIRAAGALWNRMDPSLEILEGFR